MKWMALNRKDGQRDLYAIGFVTHTVCKVYVQRKLIYEAWRLPGERLGGYSNLQDAQSECERDFRARPPMPPIVHTESDAAGSSTDSAAEVKAGRS